MKAIQQNLQHERVLFHILSFFLFLFFGVFTVGFSLHAKPLFDRCITERFPVSDGPSIGQGYHGEIYPIILNGKKHIMKVAVSPDKRNSFFEEIFYLFMLNRNGIPTIQASLLFNESGDDFILIKDFVRGKTFSEEKKDPYGPYSNTGHILFRNRLDELYTMIDNFEKKYYVSCSDLSDDNIMFDYKDNSVKVIDGLLMKSSRKVPFLISLLYKKCKSIHEILSQLLKIGKDQKIECRDGKVMIDGEEKMVSDSNKLAPIPLSF